MHNYESWEFGAGCGRLVDEASQSNRALLDGNGGHDRRLVEIRPGDMKEFFGRY
jgi:hypothetical protein